MRNYYPREQVGKTRQITPCTSLAPDLPISPGKRRPSFHSTAWFCGKRSFRPPVDGYVALSETGRYQVNVQNPFLLVALFMNPWFAIQSGVTPFPEICRVCHKVLTASPPMKPPTPGSPQADDLDLPFIPVLRFTSRPTSKLRIFPQTEPVPHLAATRSISFDVLDSLFIRAINLKE